MAGAIAAELAAAVLAHPLGVEAPPPKSQRRRNHDSDSDDSDDSDPELEFDLPLGEAAHMVRGRLGAAFAQQAMVAEAFEGCTACSRRAVDAYRSRGAGFVLEALRDPGSLEALTGLDELHASVGAMMMAAASESDSVEGGEGGGEGEGKKKEKEEKKEDDEDEEWTEL